MRVSLTLLMLISCSTLFEARAQNAATVHGCNRAVQTWNIAVDVDPNGKLYYRDGSGKDAYTLHVCPGDDVVWTGKQDVDLVTVSFSKGQDTPADDAQMVTGAQHQIQKHVKQNHTQLRYPYTTTLNRRGTQTVDDPIIIIGQ